MKDKILALFNEAGLEKYSTQFEKLIKPSLGIRMIDREEKRIPIGSSKLGGNPDLPFDFEWPKWKQYRQSFIAQINLKQLPPIAYEEMGLPREGILYFFFTTAYDAIYNEIESLDSLDSGKVIYLNINDSNLSRCDLPIVDEEEEGEDRKPSTIASRVLDFTVQWTVPTDDSIFMNIFTEEDQIKYSDIFRPSYFTLLENNNLELESDRLLGNSNTLQWDVLESGDILLFQINSYEEEGYPEWGGLCGADIYYWMSEVNFNNREFSNVKSTWQST